MVSLALAGPVSGPVNAQGVPTFDLRLFAERQAILEQTDRDLALQHDRLTREEELAEIERQQLALQALFREPTGPAQLVRLPLPLRAAGKDLNTDQ
eukprot:gene56865-75939_t